MRIAFWGDSLTEGFPGSSFYDKLTDRLPNHELINFGYAGDTAKTLYYRLISQSDYESWQLCFLWVGTNDVFYYGPYQQEHGIDEFQHYYRLIIEHLSNYADNIITIPPLIIGEQPQGEWNFEAENYVNIISEITSTYKNTDFLNLRKAFLHEITHNPNLPLTTDGVHLNRKGAYLIAQHLEAYITSLEKEH